MEIEHIDAAKIPEEVHKHLKLESMSELFEMLDADGSGEITLDEFLDGLTNLCLATLSEVPSETILLLKLVRTCRRLSSQVHRTLQEVKNIQNRNTALLERMSYAQAGVESSTKS